MPAEFTESVIAEFRVYGGRAGRVTGAAHAELWTRVVMAPPALAGFQAKAARQIPLFTLTRRTP